MNNTEMFNEKIVIFNERDYSDIKSIHTLVRIQWNIYLKCMT